MSEFWVSKKRYWCKYCETFITDDKPSRTLHENGLRHQGNKDRYVRQIYKTGEKRKRDLADEQREMAAINSAAEASFADDIASGRGGSGGSNIGPSQQKPADASSSKPKKPVDKWANYTTAASLGIRDEEAELQAMLAAQRSREGTVGAWQVVVPPPPPLPTQQLDEKPLLQEEDVDVKPTPKKQEEVPVPEDDEDTRNFKVKKKGKMMYGLGKIYEPGAIKLKKTPEELQRELEEQQALQVELAEELERKKEIEKLVQQAREEEQQSAKGTKGWKSASTWETVDEVNISVVPTLEVPEEEVPPEVPAEDVPQEPEPEPELPANEPSVTFKKRKGPANTVRRGVGRGRF